MAGEHLRRYEKGDRASASHINTLGEILGVNIKQGSHAASLDRGVVNSILAEAQLTQAVLIVSDKQVDSDDPELNAQYSVKLRYYDHDAELWKTYEDPNDEEAFQFRLDTSEFVQLLRVGDKLVGYWDPQRQVFVPAGHPKPYCKPLVDYAAKDFVVDPEIQSGGCRVVEFALEISFDERNWFIVNDRKYSIPFPDSLFDASNPSGATYICGDIQAGVSGTGIYTFRVNKQAWVRLRVAVRFGTQKLVKFAFAAVRLKGKCGESIKNKTSVFPLQDGIVVKPLSEEARIWNDATELEINQPQFRVDENTGHIRIINAEYQTPLSGGRYNSTYDNWTIEAEVSIRAAEIIDDSLGAEGQSESSGGSSSVNSSSTSSASTASSESTSVNSSSSTSSLNSSSSTSASSRSSESSSGSSQSTSSSQSLSTSSASTSTSPSSVNSSSSSLGYSSSSSSTPSSQSLSSSTLSSSSNSSSTSSSEASSSTPSSASTSSVGTSSSTSSSSSSPSSASSSSSSSSTSSSSPSSQSDSSSSSSSTPSSASTTSESSSSFSVSSVSSSSFSSSSTGDLS